MSRQLYFGEIAGIYYEFMQERVPKQLDLINEWLPGLLIIENKEDGHSEPQYKDLEYKIYADKDDKGFYGGGSSGRVTQIVGRLIGSARSNQEKGRKDAELIRKHIARLLVNDFNCIESLKLNAEGKLSVIEEDKIDDFNDLLINTVFESAEHRSVMSDYDKDNEPFPFDDFIFDDLIYDAAYQLSLGTKEGLANGYLWLLLGSFLRNEVGSLLKMYHSGFIAINRQPSEKGTLLDKLNFMFNPNEYEATYSGSDFDKKYPGTTWKCDNCGEILDYQDGFDDHYEFWQCRRCGHLNRIAIDQIYDNEETYLNGGDPVDSDQFYEALAERNMQEEITDDTTYKQAIDIIESRPYKQAVMYTPYGNGYLVIAETIEAGDSQYYLYYVDDKGNATLKDASDIEDYHELEFYDLI